MSKSKVLFFGLAVLLICTSWLWAQAPGNGVATAGAARNDNKKKITNDDVVKMTDEIIRQVGEIRGLKLLHPVKSGAKSRAEIEQMVIQNFNEEYTPEELDAEYKTLLAFGLVPKGFKYREFLVKLLTEQIAGFYDPKKKEFNLADWNPLELQKTVMAHELVHVLQDQHFDLLRFDKWPKGDSDREAAIHALIEGDATALMLDHMLKPMGGSVTKLPINLLNQMNEAGNAPGMEVINSAPNAIREGLIFPYSYGLLFTAQLLKDKGWEGVSKAYSDLPQSTEQVLHYEKYAAQEMPVKVELADVAGVLGPGWNRVNFDINGEYGYYIVLTEYLKKDEAKRAAEGWGGDQYALYENAAKTKTTLVHLSVWDNEKEAQEFYSSYGLRTANRYPKVKPLITAKGVSYNTMDGATQIELRGSSVLIVEGAATVKVKALTAKLWESKIVGGQ